MLVTAVIAEYNPFHLGHAHHLAEARRLSGADYVVAIMSGCFTQRGDAAILSPAARAEMALRCGADAVILLPTLWAVRDAEHFALGGVQLMQLIGADAISFGAETSDTAKLTACARLLEDDTALSEALRAGLSAGLSYPAALHQAVCASDPSIEDVLASPNNTLAVCYLRAMMRLHATMAVCPVARHTAYHATALAEALPSATALRAAIRRGDWAGAARAMPSEACAVLRREAMAHRLTSADALSEALLYRLRTMTATEQAALPDISEGIEDRLCAAAKVAADRDALLLSAKTRRYPYARLSRLCTSAMLGMTQTLLDETPLPPAAWLLGFRRDAAPLLTHMKRSGAPLLVKAADYADREAPWFLLEQRAYDLWALANRLPSGMAMTQGVVVV